MTNTAKGTFDVKMTPAETGAAHDRFALSKTYQGAMEGLAKGEMLAAMTAVENSQTYVAVETFTGSVDGKTGSFMLAHRGIRNKGEAELSIIIVPDSGEGALAGITGQLDIQIEEGKHFYRLDYQLPAAS